MKMKKLAMAAAVAVALTASFAFKAAPKKFYVVSSIWDPEITYECDDLVPTNTDDCVTFGAGAQCTSYLNATYPENPSYQSAYTTCVYPLYHTYAH